MIPFFVVFQGSAGLVGPIGPSGIPGPKVWFYLPNGYSPFMSLWCHKISLSFFRVFQGIRAFLESKVIRWFKYLHYHRDNFLSHAFFFFFWADTTYKLFHFNKWAHICTINYIIFLRSRNIEKLFFVINICFLIIFHVCKPCLCEMCSPGGTRRGRGARRAGVSWRQGKWQWQLFKKSVHYLNQVFFVRIWHRSVFTCLVCNRLLTFRIFAWILFSSL